MTGPLVIQVIDSKRVQTVKAAASERDESSLSRCLFASPRASADYTCVRLRKRKKNTDHTLSCVCPSPLPHSIGQAKHDDRSMATSRANAEREEGRRGCRQCFRSAGNSVRRTGRTANRRDRGSEQRLATNLKSGARDDEETRTDGGPRREDGGEKRGKKREGRRRGEEGCRTMQRNHLTREKSERPRRRERLASGEIEGWVAGFRLSVAIATSAALWLGRKGYGR